MRRLPILPYCLGLPALVSTLLFAILAPASEVAGVLTLDYFGPARPFELSEVLKNHLGDFQGRKLAAVTLYMAPRQSDKNVEARLKIAELILPQEMLAYRPDGFDEYKPLTFRFVPQDPGDLTTLAVEFNSEVAIYKVEFTYEGDPNCSFDGDDCLARIEKLGSLSEQNLYEEENLGTVDRLTRKMAAEELAQYASKKTARILLDRMEYDGVWVDYDLRSAARKSLVKVFAQLSAKSGEIRLAELIQDFFQNVEQRQNWEFLIDQLATFKTSAALFFLIKFHTYSPTSQGHWGEVLLKELFDRPDFKDTVAHYQTRILSEIFGPQSDDSEWSQTRACLVFAVAPQAGVSPVILPMIASSQSYGMQDQCATAIEEATKKLQLAEELTPFEDDLIAVITGPYHPRRPGQIFSGGFEWAYSYRHMAVTVLGEIRSTKGLEALQKALLVPEIEDGVRELIQDTLQSWTR